MSKLYTVIYTFEADDDQQATDMFAHGYYLEADPQFTWTLTEPRALKEYQADLKHKLALARAKELTVVEP